MTKPTYDRTPRGSAKRSRDRARDRAIGGMTDLAESLCETSRRMKIEGHAEDDHVVLSQAFGNVLGLLTHLARAQGVAEALEFDEPPTP